MTLGNLDPVPWMIDGGAKHNAHIGRQLADDIAPGANGIREAKDFLVLEDNVPGPAVRIRPGGYTAQSLSNEGEAYKGRAGSESLVTIPATGSSPTTDTIRWILIAIEDPNHGGKAPPSVVNGPYNFFYVVDDIDLPLVNYPHVLLAKITQPPNTGTITNAMIEDVRELANPRSKTARWAVPNVAGDEGLALNADGPDGEWFPNANGNALFKIPYWATRAQITAHWLDVRFDANVNPYGQYWVEFGPYLRPSTRERSTQRFGHNHFAIGSVTTDTWILGDDVYIPARTQNGDKFRGSSQLFVMKAKQGGVDRGVTMYSQSGVILDVRFLEEPDPVE